MAIPITPGRPADEDEARLLDLERRGTMRRGKGGVEEDILKPGPRPNGRPTSEMIVDERRSGW